ncbi:linear amide C-N hydrolase [Polynucleobacter sp. MWH-UH35A]|uniref:linear amide C-N hydrolase n=1 Tax=Polynucleobacter sp. MWH-UH35A TaxID=1855619 RepID=UPI001BFDFB1B|nr:linear amide C-N hydrolase [Polynucleobacter sp. MWH-UH35A]QWD59544.1 linear amide C-N hydrolase [Polynucleobacter sp. MWH-UH35A]
MSPKKILSAFIAGSIVVTSIGNAIACTSIMVTDTAGLAYHGRTLEFSNILPTNMTYMPVGTRIESFTSAGKQGKTFNTKYALIGMSAQLLPNAKQPTFADGMNDHGLSMKTNWLNSTTDVPVGNDDAKTLAVTDLYPWILGNFKSVAEVKASLANKEVDIWLPVVAAISPNPFPQHYHVVDKTGDNMVIEFTNGKMNVYDNPVAVMTNGPDFPWHLESLNNYTFTNVNKNTGQLGKLKLATQDAGIALTALPSAETSQGRFVKAAFYANYVRKGKTPDEAVINLAHILNNFDRPYDLTIDAGGGSGDGVRSRSTSSEVTIWTTMSDLNRNQYYVRSINGMNFAVVDLNKLKDVKQTKSINTYEVDNAVGDVFTKFLK